MSGEIKALIFDVFGSVVDWRSGIIREGEAVLSTEIDGIPVDISVGDQGVAVDEAAIEEARRRVDERRFEARNRREESAGSGGAAN